MSHSHTSDKAFIRTIARYASSQIYKNILGFLNSFIKPRLLSPEYYGIWNILTLLPQYALFAHLGSRESMKYMIAYHESRGEHEQTKRVIGSSYHASLWVMFVVVVGVLAAAFMGHFQQPMRLGLFAVSSVIFLEFFMYHYLNHLKGLQEFTIVSNSNFVDATFTFIFNILLIYFFNIYGMFLAAIASTFVTVVYIKRSFAFPRTLPFSFKKYLSLVKIGSPVTLMNFVSMLLFSVDRMIITWLLGFKELGYYSISLMVIDFLMHVPSASREVLEPKLIANMARHPEDVILQEYLIKPLINVSFYMPLLIGMIYFTIPIAIPLILPAYHDAIWPTQVLTITSLFLSLTYITRGWIIAYQLQFKACLISLAIVVIQATLSILFIKMNLGLLGIAYSNCVSQSFQIIALLALITYKRPSLMKGASKKLSVILFPISLMIFLFLGLEFISMKLSLPLLGHTLLNLVIFCSVFIFLISVCSKRLNMISPIPIRKIFSIKVLKWIYSKGLTFFPVERSVGLIRSRVRRAPLATLLMYHRVLPENVKPFSSSPKGIVVSQENFERQIKFLNSHYDIIPLDDYIRARSDHTPLPSRSLILTFDDGYADNYLYAYPILKSFSLSAIIYLSTLYIGKQDLFWQQKVNHLVCQWIKEGARDIISDEIFSDPRLKKIMGQLSKDPSSDKLAYEWIETLKMLDPTARQNIILGFENRLSNIDYNLTHDRFLTWEETLEMSSHQISFGSHSASHALLTSLDLDQVSQELSSSREMIENRLKTPVLHFSYPNGLFNAPIQKLVQQHGYRSALSTLPGICDGKTDLWALKRINLHDNKTSDPSGNFSLSLFRCYVSNLL